MLEQKIATSEELLSPIEVSHVVILHDKLRQRYEDIFLADIIRALLRFDHQVTIYTSCLDDDNSLDAIHPKYGKLQVIYSGWWVPNSICGMFRKFMLRIKAICMVLRLVVFPPRPKPKVVIIDTDTITLSLLSNFSTYKTFYIHHFPQLRYSDYYHCSMQVTSDLLTAKSLPYADEIIVQTQRLRDIFKRSFPKIEKKPAVLHPCVDTGHWGEEIIDVRRIIPDLPEDYILFVSFGEYKKKSNLKLVLDAFDHIFAITMDPIRDKIHIVIGGHCSERSADQKLYYDELIQKLSGKPYASQVTLLKQLPTMHKKTLLSSCTALIHPGRHDVYPGSILAAMSMGRIVIAVNCGFAYDVLMHRITGILVEPDPYKFAKVMLKLATSGTLQSFIGEMSKHSFNALYSFDCFSRLLNNLITKNTNPKYGRNHLNYD